MKLGQVFSSKINNLVLVGITLASLVVTIAVLIYFFTFVSTKNREVGSNQVVKAIEAQNDAEKVEENSGAQVQVAGSSPEIEALVQKVFKHIFLPSGDIKVLTVIDAEILRKQEPVFYQFAKPGDKVLVYSDRIILYDPVVDKVLDVAHLSK